MNKYVKKILWLFGIVMLTLTLGVSCKDKKQKAEEADGSEYADRLEEQAEELNSQCPKQLANGMELISVTFKGKTQLYRYKVTDQQIVTINLEQARDSIIAKLTENEKEYLINGKCSQEHRYVSPNDSSSITIIPNELEEKDEDEE